MGAPEAAIPDAVVLAAFCNAYNAHFDSPAVEPYDREVIAGLAAAGRVLAERLRAVAANPAVAAGTRVGYEDASFYVENLCGLAPPAAPLDGDTE